jgi:hypothetical protein
MQLIPGFNPANSWPLFFQAGKPEAAWLVDMPMITKPGHTLSKEQFHECSLSTPRRIWTLCQ